MRVQKRREDRRDEQGQNEVPDQPVKQDRDREREQEQERDPRLGD